MMFNPFKKLGVLCTIWSSVFSPRVALVVLPCQAIDGHAGRLGRRTDGRTSGQTGGRLAPPNPNEMPE